MTIEDFARTTTTTHRSPAHALRGLCGGTIHLPGDPGYDAARTAWNLAVDQRPAAVALPRDADEVARVVRAAHAAGRLDDVVIVRTSELNDITVDPERRIVRVGGGTVWLPAVQAAAEHGLT